MSNLDFKDKKEIIIHELIEQKELNINLDRSQIDLRVYDLNEINKDIDININLKNNSKLNIIFSVFSKNNEKSYNIKSNNLDKETKIDIKFFGIADSNATLKANVTGFISKGSIKSEMFQKIKILNIGDNNKVYANPILLIEENDILAGHAADVSQINLEEIYYMQSRGINDTNAKKMITYGLLKNIDKDLDDQLKENINNIIKEQIEKRL